MRAAAKAGFIRADNLVAAMLDYPASFCLAPANTHLRAIHSYLAQKSFTLNSYFLGSGRDKKTVEKEIVEHFQDMFNRTGKGLRPLQVMAEAGIISALPDWVPEPQTPLRQRARPTPSP